MSQKLQELRSAIDRCDHELHKLFHKRLTIVAGIADFKKEQGLPIYDPAREGKILSRYEGLEREFFQNLLRLSKKYQSERLFPYTIVLIGFMGVGKTSVGRILGEQLGREFVDLDEVLEKRLGMAISQYFSAYGEGAFRTQERESLKEVAKLDQLVLATGGGAVLDPLNVAALKQRGRLVLLTASPETIYRRLKDDGSRPLLGGEVNLERIKELVDKRKPLYEGAGELILATDDYSPDEVAGQIVQGLLQFDNKGASR